MGTLRIMVLGVAALGATCAIATCQSGGESSIRPNPETRVDQRGHELVLIPVGTFTMGIDEEQAADICRADGVEHICAQDLMLYMGDAFPPHQVTIDTEYWIDVYEVSNAQYQACVDAGVCQEPATINSRSVADYFENPEYADYPVVNIDLSLAVQFCEEWRNGYLPSEVEWEYAARGGDGRLWPWGSSSTEFYDFMNYQRQVGVFDDRTIGDTVPVTSYSNGMSPFGLYNMAGNVKEWTSTAYSPYPDGILSSPDLQVEGWQVIRGGGFRDEIWIANAVFRDISRPTHAFSDFGFRCAAPSN